MKPDELKKNHIYYRHPKTTQEKRKSYDCPDEVKIRAKRNAKNLTDAWDDNFVEKSLYKCWKYKRKTQYRDKKKYKKIFIKNAPYDLLDFLDQNNIKYKVSNTNKWLRLFIDIVCYLEEKQFKALDMEMERISNTIWNSRLSRMYEYYCLNF